MGTHKRSKKPNFDIGSQISKWDKTWRNSYREMMKNQDIVPSDDDY